MTSPNQPPNPPIAAVQMPVAPASRQRLLYKLSKLGITLASVSLIGFAGSSWAQSYSSTSKSRLQISEKHHVGFASYYARKFSGRTMADGTPMRPESDNAASLSLPLGSKALVTNLRNGRTAVVTIRDRGPFIKGRIIDVSPSTAKLLGILKVGVAKVAVVPLDLLPTEEKLEAIIAAADAGEAENRAGSP